ncbi:hypothetical protein GQ600_19596 [Phytophthora cactorum]|nr:hypothetical protein GQ600_19596 [Phytophthora cactorum]
MERISIVSLDDDLIRLRSQSFDDLGLSHIRNTKKGEFDNMELKCYVKLTAANVISRFGPVQHGIVSLLTGSFLGGHVAARGESTLEILQRSLYGASSESQIRLPGIIHALDRGYQSAAVNEQIHSVGGKVIGTRKRTGRLPFTYGKRGSTYHREVDEKGELSAYWATTKNARSGVNHKSQLLHNIVCGGVEGGFPIYASQTEVIRVVHVRVAEEVSTTYRAALAVIRDAHLRWVYEENGAIPCFFQHELGHCIDFYTLSQNLQLWKSLVRPLPPAKHIIPSLLVKL